MIPSREDGLSEILFLLFLSGVGLVGEIFCAIFLAAVAIFGIAVLSLVVTLAFRLF